jgi:hypothetical protein
MRVSRQEIRGLNDGRQKLDWAAGRIHSFSLPRP